MHRQWNSPVHLLEIQMISTWNGSMHRYISVISSYTAEHNAVVVYLLYPREKNPNILYNVLGLYRAVLVREL